MMHYQKCFVAFELSEGSFCCSGKVISAVWYLTIDAMFLSECSNKYMNETWKIVGIGLYPCTVASTNSKDYNLTFRKNAVFQPMQKG